MRRLRELGRYRDRAWERRLGADGDDTGGCFSIPSDSRQGTMLSVMAGSGEGWDHVSVSTPLRTPTWYEMEQVKRMFFRDDEIAMQLHVPSSDHINIHQHCLHLWRPHASPIPLQPKGFV